MPEFTNDLTHDDLALLLLLAEKRSLTRSAMTLAWSTPKASHRLNHARALIGDELFVRSGNSLVPTKRMEALVPTMRRALEALEGIFAEERFSPLEIDRTIIFEMVDNAAAVLLAPEAAAASITAAMLPTRRDSAKAEESRFIRILREKACVIFNMDNPADDD
ncbi:LysR family transcriptional regulator [Sutterella wadsworthensis]|uniref:LysR family transcriptional regulator n=1 Tax=Sutterella wadsworthensis TaxID=40545 RepID=UPI003AAC2E00